MTVNVAGGGSHAACSCVQDLLPPGRLAVVNVAKSKRARIGRGPVMQVQLAAGLANGRHFLPPRPGTALA